MWILLQSLPFPEFSIVQLTVHTLSKKKIKNLLTKEQEVQSKLGEILQQSEVNVAVFPRILWMVT